MQYQHLRCTPAAEPNLHELADNPNDGLMDLKTKFDILFMIKLNYLINYYQQHPDLLPTQITTNG